MDILHLGNKLVPSPTLWLFEKNKIGIPRERSLLGIPRLFPLFLSSPIHGTRNYICSFCFREALGFYLGQVAIIYSSNTSDACWTQTPSF